VSGAETLIFWAVQPYQVKKEKRKSWKKWVVSNVCRVWILIEIRTILNENFHMCPLSFRTDVFHITSNSFQAVVWMVSLPFLSHPVHFLSGRCLGGTITVSFTSRPLPFWQMSVLYQ
jgi:hypothetical protein